MSQYSKGEISIDLIKNKKINIFNGSDTYQVLYIPNIDSGALFNFNELEIKGSALVFLSPNDVFISHNKVVNCEIITFFVKCKLETEKLILLLFNSIKRKESVFGAIHLLKMSVKNKIDAYYKKIKTLIKLPKTSIEELKCIINSIVVEGSCDKMFGQYKEIQRFNKMVNSNIKDNHLVLDYAHELGFAPKSLLKLFKTKGYKNPSTIIKERLLLEAKRLLTTTDLNMRQVALELGFEDPAYFARFFKKNEGKTALVFKNNFVKKEAR